MDTADNKELGRKFDANKPKYSLLPPVALLEVVKVLTFGANKYSIKGNCNCHVNLVNEIVRFGPKGFASLATTLKTNKKTLTHIETGCEDTETQIEKLSMLIKSNGWLTTLMQRSNIDVEGLKEFTDYQTNNLILCLHNLLVQYVDQSISCASTTTTTLEKLESDFVKAVTSHLVFLKERTGHLRHSNTCGSTTLISGADNWRYVDNAPQRYFDAANRHMWQWWNGEELDSETNLHHLASAISNLMFILDLELRYGRDAKA